MDVATLYSRLWQVDCGTRVVVHRLSEFVVILCDKGACSESADICLSSPSVTFVCDPAYVKSDAVLLVVVRGPFALLK